MGTDFWIAFPPNEGSGDSLTVFISSNFATSGTLSSAYPGINQAFNVVPGVMTQIRVPPGVGQAGGTEDKGIRVTSNDPITVYGLNHLAASTDAYLAIPINALGLDYRVVSYQVDVNFSSDFSVVATQDGTVLTIFNHQTNSTYNVNLNQGQTYLERSTASGSDLTGSRIQSNFPVGVFGSNELADVPSGCATGDYIVEMMFPYYSWGKNFVTVPLAGRNNSGDIFRIVTATDGTDITINGTVVTTINSGDYYETNLTGYNSISTSNATILAQFAKGQMCGSGVPHIGDPFMMLIPPEEQFLTNYTIINVSGAFSSQWVNIVAPGTALNAIYQDGVLIPSTAFTQISTTNFYGAQRSVTSGTHTFNSTFPFGVFIYGWGNADSYGYPGGSSFSPVGMVNNITLSPDTSYGQLNVTNVCLTAHVTDNLLNPVAGVLVNFHVIGTNPLTGNGYTDASGNAQYCYTQPGIVPETDRVYAELFGFTSDTVIVIWSYTAPCSNPTNGGTIGSDQAGCGSYIPATIASLILPTGQAGTLEYKWQSSITGSSSGFTDISGSNSASYTPGMIIQTTWYKRISRVACMTDWSGAVESNVIVTSVSTPLPVSVTISGSMNNACAGTSITFSATPSNQGITPIYQWKVNGINAGTDSIGFTYIPSNGDIVSCTLASSGTCTTNNPATSNAITMVVNPNLLVSITLTALPATICAGSPVNFTAHPTNGGLTPSYSWKVNGTGVGINSPTYSYIPLNGDLVSCTLTSSELCTTNNPASSIQYPVSVTPLSPVSITISPSQNPFCLGSPVTFTAIPGSGGALPVYQWQVNGVSVGSNSSSYTYNPANGDLVTCVLTSSATCTSGNPATSNSITMNAISGIAAGVTIGASSNPFCPGSSVTFTAHPRNGGVAPVYSWKVNGVNVGTNSTTYSYLPANGDSIRCGMISNMACVTGNPASSAEIILSGTLASVVTFSSCFDTLTTINAKPIRLKGGIPLGGIYSGPGVNSGTGIFTPSLAGTGTKTITYTYTNAALCSSNKNIHVIVQASAAFNCGNNLIDIRDNTSYTTIKIGSQCWLSKNLNYGTIIASSQDQRDDCVPEKYCYQDNPINCGTQGGLYQWDKLMQFDNTPADQGLCPPAWHIPTENDWNTLFANYINNGFAGSPLKYSGFSGFNALLYGARHINSGWDFNGFATFFWSSTSYGGYKAWAHGMNESDPSVSIYPASRVNAFSVRCVED